MQLVCRRFWNRESTQHQSVIRREMTELHAAMASGGGGRACSRFIVEKQELGGESGS